MAVRDDDTDDQEKGSKKKLFIMLLVMTMMLGSGILGTLYFTGMLQGGGVKQGIAENGQPQEVKPVIEEVKKEPIYYAFEQPFTVNFETDSGLRFLQVAVEIMSHDPEAIAAVESHLPVIKNNIILLFSAQTYETLVTREGKDSLREQTLLEVQGVLRRYYGAPGVEEVYFTSFVMQ